MASVYYQVLQGTGARVANITNLLPDSVGIGLPVPVSVRKKPLILDQVDTVPRLLVWPGKQGESKGKQGFGTPGGQGGPTWWLYPVNVALVTAGNREVEVGLQEYLDMREQLRDLIYQTAPLFPPASLVTAQAFDVEIEPEDVFDLRAFLGGNYDVTGMQVQFSATVRRLS